MMTKPQFELRLKLGLLAVLVVLGLGLFIAYRNSRQFQIVSKETMIAHETIRELEGIVATMVDAETGMRGFVISADETFLEPYTKARTEIGPRMAHLRELGGVGREQFVKLRELIDEQFAFRERVIEQARRDGDEAIEKTMELTEGRVGMDALRRHVNGMKSEQQRRLDDRRDASKASDHRTMRLLATFGTLIVALMAAGVFLVRHYFNQRLLVEEERNRAIHKLEELNEETRKRSAELEALNQELEAFSYSVSHDLRAPLRHIAGFADMLKRNSEKQLDEKGKRYLQTIMDSAKRMGMLIDDLLVFSRMGRTEMREERVDLNSMVTEAIEELKLEVGGRQVVWKMERLPMVDGDPAMLRQVVTNLLSNAVKYSAPRDPAIIEVSGSQKNGEVIVSVRDNGVGFDPAYAHKLFGVFQRLHQASEFEGTGIGLANVRRIVSRHGGKVWAEAELDKGATFHFSLPKSKISHVAIEKNSAG